MINHPIGEWWPLLTREGKPIWTHMSHSWKVNYHTIRCMVECIKRLEELLETLQ
jgi:mannose/cellobiose epimerase-like protein (N-acyl-D-glucosamine 2-epimerase family)